MESELPLYSLYQLQFHRLCVKDLWINEYTNINHKRCGRKTFDAQCISDVKTQGSGKTSEDWYRGYYDNARHTSSSLLGANGKLFCSSLRAD